MSEPELHLSAQSKPVDPEAARAAQRQHHKERLARLFRQTSDSAEDRFLLDFVRRYREIETS